MKIPASTLVSVGGPTSRFEMLSRSQSVSNHAISVRKDPPCVRSAADTGLLSRQDGPCVGIPAALRS